ncbi:hypothetical protein C8J57DRAFT_965201, partial [Mycena rebaudengoi]
IFVKNNSSQAVDCFVSKYSNANGDDAWFRLAAGASDTWGRGDGWELVAFKVAGSNDVHGPRGGVYVRTGSSMTYSKFDLI